MDRERFKTLVATALDNLPEEFHRRLDNIVVVVGDRPSKSQLTRLGMSPGMTLLGLYEGVPLPRRGTGYAMVLPDKITIFQQAVEGICRDERQIPGEIERVLKHEIAHHFGISDARLKEIERER
ncbi:MAG: metallopeptidase family protein [Chloroflexota bacterium]